MDRKQTFLDYKNVDFRSSPTLNFSKGLAHDFCVKFEMLTFDSYGKIGLEIASSHPLVTKPAFLYFKFSISDSRQI